MADSFDKALDEAMEKAYAHGTVAAYTVFALYADLGYCPFCCLREVRRHFELPDKDEVRH
jgi:hypothetical protein